MPSLKEEVFALLKEVGLDDMTQKKVRRALEKRMGLEEEAMDDKKTQIKNLVKEYVKNHHEESEEEEEEEKEDKSASKKRKRADDDAEVPEKPKQPPVKTKSGKLPPKGVKANQAGAMTGAHFEKKAEDLTVNVFGNMVTGPPRSFTSGNRGWYLGGKVEVQVGKKTLWAQMGLNLTIVGSKDWD